MAAEEAANAERGKALEQERLDRELALRLAQEDQDQVEAMSGPVPLQRLAVSEFCNFLPENLLGQSLTMLPL